MSATGKQSPAPDVAPIRGSATPPGVGRSWVLAIGTFAVGTDAFVMAGLLPDLSTGLHVGLGAAGQVVTVFSVAYAVAAIVLGTASARVARRTLMVLALAVFVLGNALTALAATYVLVLAARVVAAVGAALFTAAASSTASRLAGASARGRAIAIVMFGLTSSLVLGAPLGTALGAAFGWRSAMWVVAGLGLVSLLVVRLLLPQVAPDAGAGFAQFRGLITDRRVVLLLVQTFVVYSAIYIPYTYVSATFSTAIAKGLGLTVVLLCFGVAASVGNLVAGGLADRVGPRAVISVALTIVIVLFAVLPALRDNVAGSVCAVVVFGLSAFAITTPQQHRLLTFAPGPRAQATSLYQGVLYGAVSIAGAVGALALGLVGSAHLSLVAAVIAVPALVLNALDRTRGRTAQREETDRGG